MSKKNFIQDCINGNALLEEIVDYIDAWHENDSEDTIYDFLGMSQKEYRMWVENDDILKYIIKAHLENNDIDDVLCQDYNDKLKIVARTDSPDEVKFIYSWLVRTGRIKE